MAGDSSVGGFRRDDRVQVWSASQKAWLEGRVVEVVAEAVTTEEGHTVPPGTIRIATARTVMLVPPGKVSEVVRPVSDEAAFVAVLAPGAGVKANKSVYSDLKRDARFRVQVLGARGESYDRYPEHWDGGSAPPNLESFAGDLLADGNIMRADCIVAGSRGGQVIIPAIWRALGTACPPAVVINGGCAMGLPGPRIIWPVNAVTILVLGGEDYFRSGTPAPEYIAGTKRRVPSGNTSTAILFVREMEHMPQTSLMKMLLASLLLSAIYWRASGRAPSFELRSIVKDLEAKGWNGQLSYLDSGGAWTDVAYGSKGIDPVSPVKAVSALAAKTPSEIAAEQEDEKARQLEVRISAKEKELELLRAELADCRSKSSCLRQTAQIERAAAGRSGQATPQQSAGGYQKGQKVHYWSVTQNGWLECEVIAVRPKDGAVQISVKPDFWIQAEEQAQRMRPVTATTGGGASASAAPGGYPPTPPMQGAVAAPAPGAHGMRLPHGAVEPAGSARPAAQYYVAQPAGSPIVAGAQSPYAAARMHLAAVPGGTPIRQVLQGN